MKMRRLILIVMSLFCIHTIMAQEARMKVLYIYNFTNHLEWPEEYKKGDFIIGILGDAELASEFEKLLSSRTVSGQNIVIQSLNELKDIDFTTSILLISESRTSEVRAIKDRMGNANVVIITEKTGAIRESGINLINSGGKLLFEINKGNLEKNNVKVSGTLCKMAVKVL